MIKSESDSSEESQTCLTRQLEILIAEEGITDPKDLELIRSFGDKNFHPTKYGEEIGISRMGVIHHLNRLGLAFNDGNKKIIPYKDYNLLTDEELTRRLKEGASFKQLGREYRCSDNTIKYRAGRLGVTSFGRRTRPTTGSSKKEHDQEIFFPAAKVDEDGAVGIMAIEEYCEYYGFDYSTVRSSKLIQHAGGAYYNIHFVEKENRKVQEDCQKGIEHTREVLKNWIGTVAKQPIPHGDRIAMVVVADLHIGAMVTSLSKTPDFNKETVMTYLKEAAEKVNSFGYDVVDIACLGDLVETVSGLNHQNSWQSIGHGDHGANIIQTATEVIDQCFLSQIHNLRHVKIVAGNHDRLSSKKDEDVHGGAAHLISWALGLMGYHTEFHPICIRHEVDGICYVLLHGDRGVSKRPSKEIVWDYGKQGVYNVILEGHLHCRTESNMKGKSPELKHLTHSDSRDTRRFICPSFFTGNFYAEENNWFSTPGFKIFESNGKGKPNVMDFTL